MPAPAPAFVLIIGHHCARTCKVPLNDIRLSVIGIGLKADKYAFTARHFIELSLQICLVILKANIMRTRTFRVTELSGVSVLDLSEALQFSPSTARKENATYVRSLWW